MPSDTKNVKLGVCSISFGGKDLGYTKGGVEVTVETETKKITVDQFGQSVINEVIIGRNVTVVAPLAETTLENLVEIMPGATLTGADATKKVDVLTGVGVSLLDTAKVLVLHPIAKPANDKSEDFTIPKAATAGAINYAYKLDEEKIYNTTFTGYPDPVTGKLFTVGAAA